MDKHLLAENPIRSPKGGLCVVRTVKPISIFEIIHGHVEANKPFKYYTYVGDLGIREQYTLVINFMFAEGVASSEELESEYMTKYLDDAAHWYNAYLRFEDCQ